MIVRLSVLLALVAQVAPLAGPGAFYLCVHEDGEAQFELAMKPCCEGAGIAPSKSVSGSASVGPAGIAPGCDHCRDYSLTFAQIGVSQGECNSSLSAVDAFSPACPQEPFLALDRVPPPEGRAHSSGPPFGPGVLSRLKTVVLQV